jgi:hypothetical protein
MQGLGGWAFLIGIILAIVFGALSGATGIQETIAIILLIIGIVVGFLNVTDKEIKPFMYAGTILVIVSFFGGSIMGTIGFIKGILDAILYIFVPATIVVAIKSVFSIAKK